jgi:hypothetical protein
MRVGPVDGKIDGQTKAGNVGASVGPRDVTTGINEMGSVGIELSVVVGN